MSVWLQHDGGGISVTRGKRVDVKFRDGEILLEQNPYDWLDYWDWEIGSEDGLDIVEWRRA